MAVVLIGFADALAAPEAVFSLRAAGHDVRAFARRGSRPPILRWLDLGEAIEIAAPEHDAAQAVQDLGSAFARGGFDLALGLDDVALWLIDRAGVKAASATGPALAYALDKAKQIEAAAAAGLHAPPTVLARGPADIPDDLAYPAIVKPSLAAELDGGALAKGGAFYLERRADADAMPVRAAGQAPFLVQPLIHGVGEGVFGFATAAGPVAWSGHRRLRMMNPHGSGASACEPATPEPELRAAAGRFIRAIDWRGPFMLEMLRDASGTPWFMELNGRLWGSTALARRMGFEYPAWAVAQALDPDFAPDEPPPRPSIEVRHLGRDLLHLAFVARGPKSAFHRKGWPNLLGAIPKVLWPAAPSRFYNYDPAYPTFFLKEAAATVAGILRRKR